MMAVKICPACKTNNPSDAEVCSNCKTSLKAIDVSTVLVPGELPSLPATVNREYIKNLPDNTLAVMIMGQQIPVMIAGRAKVFFGRVGFEEQRQTFDLSPFGAERLGVSRQHAVITPTAKGYILEDLGSTNGTWVNATRVRPYAPHALRSGDLIRFAQLTLFAYFKEPGQLSQQMFNLRLSQEMGAISLASGISLLVLEKYLLAYLKAIEGVQLIINEMRGVDDNILLVNSISYDVETHSCAVQVAGFEQVLSWAQTRLMDWRTANPDVVKKALAEAEENTQTEKLSSDSLLLKLSHAQIALMQALVDESNADLTTHQKTALLRRLTPHIQLLTTSAVELFVPPEK